MNHPTNTPIAPTRSAPRNETFMVQEQLGRILPRIIGWSWARYSSFLLAHITLRWVLRTVRGSHSSADATVLPTASIVVIVHALIMSTALFADACPTSKTAKSLAWATKLSERWTPSFCTAMMYRQMGDVCAVALVVGCAYIGSVVYPPEEAVDTTQAVLLGVLGRIIFLAMRNWILKLELWLDQVAAAPTGNPRLRAV
ncbi:hypothetical protein V8D89_014475 [Ganoderma adspersum]